MKKISLFVLLVMVTSILTACGAKVELGYEDAYKQFAQNFNFQNYAIYAIAQQQSERKTMSDNFSFELGIDNEFVNGIAKLRLDTNSSVDMTDNKKNQGYGTFDLNVNLNSKLPEYIGKADMTVNGNFVLRGMVLYFDVLKADYNVNVDKSVENYEALNQQLLGGKAIIPSITNKWFSIDLLALQKINPNSLNANNMSYQDLTKIMDSFYQNVQKYPFLTKKSDMIDIDGKNGYDVELDPIAMSTIIENTINETKIKDMIFESNTMTQEEVSQNIRKNVDDLVKSFKDSDVKLQLQLLDKDNIALIRNSKDLLGKIGKGLFDISTKSNDEKLYLSIQDGDIIGGYEGADGQINMNGNIDMSAKDSSIKLNINVQKTQFNTLLKDKPIEINITSEGKTNKIDNFQMTTIDGNVIDLGKEFLGGAGISDPYGDMSGYENYTGYEDYTNEGTGDTGLEPQSGYSDEVMSDVENISNELESFGQ